MLAALVTLGPSLARGAGFEWMQTARIFLIDAYEPPFAVRLEYDANALAETMARMNANTIRIATMGKHALIPGVRFSPHPELGARDILAETIAACKPRGIRVVPYISTGHRLGWSMLTRDYPEYAQRTRPGGGPNRSVMFTGEDHGTVCWNTPYRAAYLQLVEKVVRDYDIDGIYFDTWRSGYFWPGRMVCYCDGCRDGFRKANGRELPWHERDSDYTAADDETIRQYRAWYQDGLAGTIREVRRIVKAHKDIPLIYNINNPVDLAHEDPRVRESMDGFLYERGKSILSRAEGVSLARASGLSVWPYVGEYNNWPRTINNAVDFQQQIFTTAMFGGAPILAIPWGYAGHDTNRRFVADAFGVIRKREADFAGFRNYPYAAVLYGHETPPGHARSGWWWNHDIRAASQGAFAALLYGHMQVSSIHESLLDDLAKLRAYKVLYLADQTWLSPSRIENIRQFVRSGGGLVATHAATLYDGPAGKGARPRRMDRFALEDLVKVAPMQPEGELARITGNHKSMSGGPYDLYLADRGNTAIGGLTPLWHYIPVRVSEGGEVWKEIVIGDGLKPVLPGVVVSKYGRGTVVYCASALESIFLQQNSPAVGRAIRAMVAKAAAEPAPYEVDAPAALLTNLTYKGDALLLHLTNWTGNKLEHTGLIDEYVAPVENVRVRFAIPKGARVGDVSLLVPAKFRKKRAGDILEIVLPRVQAYQGIRFTISQNGPAGGSGSTPAGKPGNKPGEQHER